MDETMNQALKTPLVPELQRRLSIVIPAFNEEDGIGVTLTGLLQAMPEAEIIVVDDASSDATAERVRTFETVKLVRHAFNRGYGGSLKTGMALATREFVAWFDADNEHRVEDLVAMASHIVTDRLAAVIAQRQIAGPSPLRNWGKGLIRLVAWTLNVRIGKDLNCGLRVFRRDVICRYLTILPDGYSASITSLMIMLERKYPIALYPIAVNRRIGHSKVRLVDGFNTLVLLIRLIMLFAPLRIFLSVGSLLIVGGLIYGIVVASIVHMGTPLAASLTILSGLLMVFFGLVADQISQFRLSSYGSTSFLIGPFDGTEDPETAASRRRVKPHLDTPSS